MPQRKAGTKALRTSHRKHMHNLDVRTGVRKAIKDFLSSIEAKNKEKAKETLRLICKKLDKAAKSNIFKKNTVSRRKSRFSKLLAKLA